MTTQLGGMAGNKCRLMSSNIFAILCDVNFGEPWSLLHSSIKHQDQDTPVDISDHINLQNIPGSICINWEQCSSAPAKLLLPLALWLLDTAVRNTSTLLPRCSTLVPIQGQTFAWNILSQVAVVSCKTAVAAVVLGAVLISARSRGAVSTVWRFEATIKPSKKCPDEFFMSI